MKYIAKNIMTKKLTTLSTDDSVFTASMTMKEKGIRHIPIVNQASMIVGILSDRDLSRALVTKMIYDSHEEKYTEADFKILKFMSIPVQKVNCNLPIKEVVNILVKNKISSVVVENDKLEIVGIITDTDIMAYLLKIFADNEESNRHILQDYLEYNDYYWHN